MRGIFWFIILWIGFWTEGAQSVGAQSCNFSATDLVFGSVNTLSSNPVDVSGTITISCGGLALGSISGTISATDGSGGSNGNLRQMADGTSGLRYQLYRNSARTNVWGAAAGGPAGAPFSFSGGNLLLGQTETIPFYGQVIGSQNLAPPGVYLSQFGPTSINIQYRICTLLLLCSNRTATFSFSVTAMVEKGCSVTAEDIDFGSTGGLASAVDASGRLDVLCTPGTDFQIGLDNGQNGTTPQDRKMRSPAGGMVRYDLYRDAGKTALWGNIFSTDTLRSTGNGATETYTVYGRVPVQPTPPAGMYTDTIIVTVTY